MFIVFVFVLFLCVVFVFVLFLFLFYFVCLFVCFFFVVCLFLFCFLLCLMCQKMTIITCKQSLKYIPRQIFLKWPNSKIAGLHKPPHLRILEAKPTDAYPTPVRGVWARIDVCLFVLVCLFVCLFVVLLFLFCFVLFFKLFLLCVYSHFILAFDTKPNDAHMNLYPSYDLYTFWKVLNTCVC